MSKKRVLQYILASLFFLFFAPLSGAQDNQGSLVIRNTERRYIQRLVWAGDEYTLRYEVVVEKDEGGSYRRVSRVFTGESFIELTLQPGNYRCRVIPYDFLNRPAEGSEWMFFEILTYTGEETPELNPETTIAEMEPEELEPEEPEPVKKEKAFDFYLSVAWMPVFPIYCEIDQFINWKSDSLCGGIRLGIVSAIQSSLNLGLEFTVSRFYFTTYSYSDEYEYEYEEIQYIDMGAFELTLLAQKWFPKRVTAFNLRTGGGMIFLQKTRNYFDSSVNSYGFFINMGFSFLWRPAKRFIIETGFDYIHLFEWESPGFLRPWVGIGMRF